MNPSASDWVGSLPTLHSSCFIPSTTLPMDRYIGLDKGRGRFGRLGNLAKAYGFMVGDTVRVKNRLRSVLRSRGVAYGAGQSV